MIEVQSEFTYVGQYEQSFLQQSLSQQEEEQGGAQIEVSQPTSHQLHLLLQAGSLLLQLSPAPTMVISPGPEVQLGTRRTPRHRGRNQQPTTT